MKNDDLQGFYEEETYTKGLSREETIERQVRICAYDYSNGHWDHFEYAIKALLALLPRDVRNEFVILDHDTTTVGVEKHYKQFVAIQEELESNTNMMFKKKFVKTFR